MKTILCVLVLLCFQGALNGQVKFGVSLGGHLTESGINSEGLEGFFFLNDKYPKIGFQGGVFLEVPLFWKINLQSGLNYIRKSFEMRAPHYQRKGTGSYLNIPVRIKYTFYDPMFLSFGCGISTLTNDFRIEGEYSGEVGFELSSKMVLSMGYRKNISYSGSINLITPVGNLGIGQKPFKFRSFYLRAGYSLNK